MSGASINPIIHPASERAGLLRHMVDALLTHRLAQADANADDKIVPLVFALAIKPQPPRWIQRMEAAAKDDVEQSLLASICEEGWRAFAEGGLAAMRALADRACDDDGGLLTIVDHHWDGIGTHAAGHWVC